MRVLDEISSKEILRRYGIPVVREELVKNDEDAISIAMKLRFPVMLKISSPKIFHKTDVGGVKEARSVDEVRKYFREIMRNARKITQDINGILIEEKVEGVELIVGVKKDSQFGHVIMFGLGGVFVELLRDVSFRAIPITLDDAFEMIDEIRTKKILEGFRNIKPVNKGKIAEILLKISKLIEENIEINELDINPLIANDRRVCAVDALIKLDDSHHNFL